MRKYREISCRNAIAYLKATTIEENNVTELSFENSPVLLDIGNELLLSFIVEVEGEYHYIQNRHLLHEGLTETELKDIGISNLEKLATAKLEIKEMNGAFIMWMQGDFEASLMLVDSLWDDAMKQYIQNDIVIAIPARDILAVCDSKNQAGVAYLETVCERVSQSGDHLITNDLLIRRGNSWVNLNA